KGSYDDYSRSCLRTGLTGVKRQRDAGHRGSATQKLSEGLVELLLVRGNAGQGLRGRGGGSGRRGRRLGAPKSDLTRIGAGGTRARLCRERTGERGKPALAAGCSGADLRYRPGRCLGRG